MMPLSFQESNFLLPPNKNIKIYVQTTQNHQVWQWIPQILQLPGFLKFAEVWDTLRYTLDKVHHPTEFTLSPSRYLEADAIPCMANCYILLGESTKASDTWRTFGVISHTKLAVESAQMRDMTHKSGDSVVRNERRSKALNDVLAVFHLSVSFGRLLHAVATRSVCHHQVTFRQMFIMVWSFYH